MGIASRSIIAEDRQLHSQQGLITALNALLDTCRSMLPVVRQATGATEGAVLAHDAERAIVRAEKELRRYSKSGRLSRHGFYGRLGNHYDFEIVLSDVREKESVIRCEGLDRHGRKMVLRVRKGDEPMPAAAGDTVFFRGRVTAHRSLFGEPVTHIEVTSGIMKLH